MKKIIFGGILPSLLLGVCIGLCIPYSLVSSICPEPLLQVCQHSFLGLVLTSIAGGRFYSCCHSCFV